MFRRRTHTSHTSGFIFITKYKQLIFKIITYSVFINFHMSSYLICLTCNIHIIFFNILMKRIAFELEYTKHQYLVLKITL